MTKKEKLEKRAKLIADARALLDKGTLSAEDSANFDAMMKEADDIKAALDKEDRLAALEASLTNPTPAAAAATPSGDPIVDMANAAMRARASDNYSQAFWNAVRSDPQMLSMENRRELQIVASQNTGTPDKGGYLVPLQYETVLIQALDNFNIMRRLATVTSSGVDRQIPVEVDIGAATWIDEEAQFPESDITVGKTNMSAHKLGRIIKVSEELLQDAFFDVASYVADCFGRTFGRAEEQAFLLGNGTGKPKGIVLDAQAGVTTAAATAVTADNVIDMYHALRRQYRNRATWLVSDAFVKAIRKLKDNDGQYLWQPSISANTPDTIMGRPVETSDDMAGLTASAVPAVFGDMKYYRIMDRKGITMQRLNELYAATGQVGFRMYSRTDGKLLLPEAVKKLTMAAA